MNHQELLGRLLHFYWELIANRVVASAAIGVGALALLIGAAAGGYALHQPVTRTVPPGAVGTGSGLRVPCSETSSGASSPVFLIVGNLPAAGLNGLYEGMCSVTISPFNRAGNGVVTLTDSAGLSTTYNLGLPAGHKLSPGRAAGGPSRPGASGASRSGVPRRHRLPFRAPAGPADTRKAVPVFGVSSCVQAII